MVPRHRRSTFGRRAFFVAGPMEWNSHSHSFFDPAWSTDCFRSALKTHLFWHKGTISALEALRDALCKSTTTTKSAVKPHSVNSAAHNAATFQRRCNYRYKGVREHIFVWLPRIYKFNTWNLQCWCCFSHTSRVSFKKKKVFFGQGMFTSFWGVKESPGGERHTPNWGLKWGGGGSTVDEGYLLPLLPIPFGLILPIVKFKKLIN